MREERERRREGGREEKRVSETTREGCHGVWGETRQ